MKSSERSRINCRGQQITTAIISLPSPTNFPLDGDGHSPVNPIPTPPTINTTSSSNIVKVSALWPPTHHQHHQHQTPSTMRWKDHGRAWHGTCLVVDVDFKPEQLVMTLKLQLQTDSWTTEGNDWIQSVYFMGFHIFLLSWLDKSWLTDVHADVVGLKKKDHCLKTTRLRGISVKHFVSVWSFHKVMVHNGKPCGSIVCDIHKLQWNLSAVWSCKQYNWARLCYSFVHYSQI